MTWVIIIAVVVIFFIYNGIEGNKDIKNIEKHGGLEVKYNVLISLGIIPRSLLRMKRNV